MPFFPPLEDEQSDYIYSVRTRSQASSAMQAPQSSGISNLPDEHHADKTEPKQHHHHHDHHDTEELGQHGDGKSHSHIASPNQNRDITSAVTENCISPHSKPVPMRDALSAQVRKLQLANMHAHT